MAREHNLLRVDLGDGFECVQGPRKAPRPGRDRAPLVRRGASLPRVVEQRLHPVLKSVVVVRVDIAVVGRDKGVAPRSIRSTCQRDALDPRVDSAGRWSVTP